MEQTRPRTTPKDFFLWAGAMVALYSSVVAFITLLFSYINYVFADTLSYYSNPYDSGMSYQMASLIVLVPLFLVLMRLIRKDIAKDPSRAEIWVRRWALFLTLFVAGATMAVDLIVLLTTFFQGEDITVRFLLKVAVVLLVAGAGFLHFLADLKGYWLANADRARMVGYGAGVLVLISIAAGFFIIGTPWDARQYRLDEQRVSDLQNIQWQIVSYWQQKQKMPVALAELNDSISGWRAPVDPETAAAYEYKVKSGTTFELCATFKNDRQLASQTNITRPVDVYSKDLSDNWDHAAGRVCFERTIDPERYPPITK